MNNVKGFTLTELLMVLIIISVTLAIGLPNFQSLIISSRLTSSANAMVSALQLARFEALKQQKNVVIANKNGQWENGWIVFIDEKKGSQAPNNQLDSNEFMLANFDALHSSLVVKIPTSYKNYVYYDKYGRINSESLGNGTFSFCSSSVLQDFRSVVIASTGRVHVELPVTLPTPTQQTSTTTTIAPSPYETKCK
jgi:type IV fimbrial biogenesis protein FimT